MDTYTILAFLILLTALFGYINVRFLKLPNTIGLMLITILYTLLVFALSYFDNTLLNLEVAFIKQIDFKTVLLDEMLSFLLFAGALHTNFQQLKVQRWPILVFSSLGVLTSTFLIGGAMYFVIHALGLNVAFIYCLLFGALISPTDPIAVLGILKKAGAPQKIETKIVGESLFNDGVGVVVFLTIFEVATSGHFNTPDVLKLFGQEVIGGVALGMILGLAAFKLIKSIDNFEIEVIITIAVVMIGSVIARKLHLSAPLAMVTAGLILGNDTSRQNSMSENTEMYVDKFWELVDVLLNAVLFVLIGMEMLVLVYDDKYLLAGLLAIPVALLCRYLSLLLPINFFKKKLNFVPKTNMIMTWGGLRGGISIALALGLSQEMHRELFLVITYVVVVFSILVQGLTIEPLIKKLGLSSKQKLPTGH